MLSIKNIEIYITFPLKWQKESLDLEHNFLKHKY